MWLWPRWNRMHGIDLCTVDERSSYCYLLLTLTLAYTIPLFNIASRTERTIRQMTQQLD